MSQTLVALVCVFIVGALLGRLLGRHEGRQQVTDLLMKRESRYRRKLYGEIEKT